MKKYIARCLPVLLILGACQPVITGIIFKESPPPPEREWTFIIYMAAENDLEAAAIHDFNELEGVDFSSYPVSVLVLFDRTAGYDATNGNWTDTRLYEVGLDTYGVNTSIISRRLDCPELDLSATAETELDMSDPMVLSHLITYAKRVYPADNYGLLIWGHGTGWRGIGEPEQELPEPLKAIAFDDTTNHYMSLPSLEGALAGKGLSLIGFDTCFAALLEVAYQLRNDAQWLIGSEGVIPANGWDYTALFNSFFQSPILDAEAFCASVVQQFSTQYAGVSGAAISQIDLAEIDSLFTSFETFAETLAQNITTSTAQDDVRTTILTDVEGYHFTTFPSDLYIDIYDFSVALINIRSSLTSDTTRQAAIENTGRALQDALQRAVPLSWAKNGTTEKLGIHLIPIQSAGVPRTNHEGEYTQGSMNMGKSAFVEDSQHWVPHLIPQPDSFLDKLFYVTL
jgi:hypothetical protein